MMRNQAELKVIPYSCSGVMQTGAKQLAEAACTSSLHKQRQPCSQEAAVAVEEEVKRML